jgi:hypothetical protein
VELVLAAVATPAVSLVTWPAIAPTQEWVVELAAPLVVDSQVDSGEALLVARVLLPATSVEVPTTLRGTARLRL